MTVHFLRVISGHRLTLNREIREALGVGVGDYLRLTMRDGAVVLEAAQ